MAALGGCRAGAPGCSGAPAFPGETARIAIVDAHTGRVLLDIPSLPSDGRRVALIPVPGSPAGPVLD